jgi:PAS domain S-box-containing protein
MNALRTLFTFSESVDAAEFHGAARDLQLRQAGIAALEWAPFVSGEDRPVVERALRAEVAADFVIKDRFDPDGFEPAPAQGSYLPIAYIEPLAPNRPALGFNLFSGRSHAEVRLSRNTGLTSMSRVSPLYVDDAPATGFVVYVPVFSSLPRPESRVPPGEFKGMVLGVFRLDRFFAATPEESFTRGFDFLVVDRTPRSPDGTVALVGDDGIVESGALPPPEEFATALSVRVPFTLWERSWEIVFRPTPAWLEQAGRRDPYTILGAGTAASAALSLLLFVRLRSTSQIRRLVEERTAELRASREALAGIMDNSPNAIFVKDLDGRYLVANRKFVEMYGGGRATVVGCTDHDLFPPEYADVFRRGDARTVASGRTETFEEVTEVAGRPVTSIVFKFPLRDSEGAVRAVGGVTTDITERKRAEAEKLAMERKLLESQKLESLGVLAGGIAHDFNNLLTGIMGNASLLGYELPRESSLHPHLRQIESAALRAAELCQQMLAYSGKGRFVVGPVDLGTLIQETVPLLRASIGKSVRLQFRLAERLPPVMADGTQMRQILMNLVINASDAIGDRGGDIVLTTGTVEADATLLRGAEQGAATTPGPCVFLEVRDTGCGMSPETRARIFDPFYTTKFAGRGLGLAAVLGIVRGHGGALFVESEPGKGSTFRLLLPARQDADGDTPRPGEQTGAEPVWTAKGRVLLVDDEEAVRFVGSHMVESFGLDCDTAADGAEGLARFDAPGARYDVVLLDLTMPGMSGEDVLRALRQRRPDLPVVLMSGFSEHEVSQRFTQDSPTAFVQKPFSVGTMRSTLRAVLGDRTA